MQLNGGRGQLVLYKNMGDAFSKIIASQGVAGLFRGVHVFFTLEIISAFMQVSLYEAMQPHKFGIE
jgi:hypothetical protein